MKPDRLHRSRLFFQICVQIRGGKYVADVFCGLLAEQRGSGGWVTGLFYGSEFVDDIGVAILADSAVFEQAEYCETELCFGEITYFL